MKFIVILLKCIKDLVETYLIYQINIIERVLLQLKNIHSSMI